MCDNQDKYLQGKLHHYYQPAPDVFPDSMCSWEVYESLENGMRDYPDIPQDKWLRFDCHDDPEPIEAPVFRD